MQPALLSDFESELRAVQEALTAAAEELGMPLGELVRVQAKQLTPALRAGLVLAVGHDPHGDTGARRRRIFLAAALEMLYIALHVHQLLVTAAALESQGDDLDKAFIGSTILAGDYCFSRAASMAAQTGSPRIVTLFAQALQTVSEGHLRVLFNPAESTFDENLSLLHAGAEAAIELAGVAPARLAEYRNAAGALADALAAPALNVQALTNLLSALPVEHQTRWQALAQWLIGTRANGWDTRRNAAPHS
jgi:octaprenyl-diphosphate synthase